MHKDPSKELRKNQRLRSKFPVRYSVVYEDPYNLSKLSKTPFPIEKLGYITNISRSGMLFFLNEALLESSILELSFRLPIRDKISLVKIKSVVRWTKVRKKEEPLYDQYTDFAYSCGVEFMKSADRVKIDEFIEYWKTFHRHEHHSHGPRRK